MPFDLQTYALFCLGALALIASPGADFFYVATRGLVGGRGAGVISALGIGVGLLVHTALAASGLTLLLLTSSAGFNALKWLGAAYLIFIGIKILRAGDEFLAPVATMERRDFKLAQVFRQGVLTNILNPKVPLTFAAFVLPFVQAERGNATIQILILGVTLCVLATSWFCGIGFFAGNLGQLLARHPRIRRGVRLFSGTAIVLLGACLAFSQRI